MISKPGEDGWMTIDTAPESEVVEVWAYGRQPQRLLRKGALWFQPDMSSYVYYRPKLWRAAGQEPVDHA